MGTCREFWRPTGPQPEPWKSSSKLVGFIQGTSQESSPFSWIFINFFCTCFSLIILVLSCFEADEINESTVNKVNSIYNIISCPLWFYQEFSLLLMGGKYPRDVMFLVLEASLALGFTVYSFYELSTWNDMLKLTDEDIAFVVLDLIIYSLLTLRCIKMACDKRKMDRLPR